MKSFSWLVIAIAGLIFGCLAFPEYTTPPPPNLACTAMGCGYTLQIELVGSVPSEFVLHAVASNGESVGVQCRDGMVVYGAETTTNKSPFCGTDMVAFLDFSPDEVMVVIEFESGTASQSFHPDYQVFRPNGPDCEPVCRTANLELRLPGP